MNKTTNIYRFLKAVPYLETIGNSICIRLAHRFNVSPETLALIIQIATEGGGLNEN